MQTIIALTVTGIAVIYSAIRIYKAFTHAGDPCRGCKGCVLKEQMQKVRHEKGSLKSKKPACYNKKA
ncbi:MAG: FeoB-associated Cys-rich membrane protein [Prevotella sp.]|nr:FeoB-associated Cys-rich membrane protein [Prevotella sp.]